MHSKSVSKSNPVFGPQSKKFLSDFLFGVMTPVRAVGIVFSRPKLLALSLAPIFATIIILSFGLYAVMAGFGTFFRQWLRTTIHGAMAQYSEGLSLIAASVIGIALIFFAMNSILFLASLLASPFNDWLAESTERVIQITDIPEQNFARFVRVFFVDLRKTFLTLTLSLIFSLGMLLPAIGIFFFLASALLTTFTFVTYPQSRRMHGVFDSAKWVTQNLGLSLGFGVVTVFLFGTPVLNLFAIPISVIAGTLLYFRSDFKN